MGNLIGIGGISRAGKSDLAHFLSANLPNANVLHQDDYVKPEGLIPKIKERVDWEHPDSINWNQWKEAIIKSQSKFQHTIAEGIFVFHDSEILTQTNWKILLTLDKELFLQRKSDDGRWGNEPDWYIEHIWNSHFQWHKETLTSDMLNFKNINRPDYLKLLIKLKGI